MHFPACACLRNAPARPPRTCVIPHPLRLQLQGVAVAARLPVLARVAALVPPAAHVTADQAYPKVLASTARRAARGAGAAAAVGAVAADGARGVAPGAQALAMELVVAHLGGGKGSQLCLAEDRGGGKSQARRHSPWNWWLHTWGRGEGDRGRLSLNKGAQGFQAPGAQALAAKAADVLVQLPPLASKGPKAPPSTHRCHDAADVLVQPL